MLHFSSFINAEVLLDMVASGGELGWLTWPDQNGVRNVKHKSFPNGWCRIL